MKEPLFNRHKVLKCPFCLRIKRPKGKMACPDCENLPHLIIKKMTNKEYVKCQAEQDNADDGLNNGDEWG